MERPTAASASVEAARGYGGAGRAVASGRWPAQVGSAAQWDGQRRGVADVELCTASCCTCRKGERKKEGRKKEKKRKKRKREREKRKRKDRAPAGFAAATAGSVEHARRSGGTQRHMQNEERGRRLISVSDGENAGKDFEELGSRTEGEFEMIRAKCRKDFEKNIFSE